MRIALGCDHGGLVLKNALIPFLRSMGHTVEDFGTYTEESCDYPDYAAAAAQAVADGDCDRGIVICTTGIGVSIVANKIRGVRCALLSDLNSARMTRLHNDTNMMALGAAVVSQDMAFAIVDAWLSTRFSDEDRHQRRIDKMMSYERGLKKKRRKNNRRRHSTLLGKITSLLLSLLLVLSLIITPITTYVTSMTEPERIVDILLNSGILDPEEPTEEPSSEPNGESPDEPNGESSEEPNGESSEEPNGESSDEPNGESSEEPNGESSDEPNGESLDEPNGESSEEPNEEPATGNNEDADPAVASLEDEGTPAAEDPSTDSTEEPSDEPSEEPSEESTEDPTAEPPADDQDNASESAGMSALFGALQDVISSDIMDEDTLHSMLELPEGSTIDTNKMSEQLAESEAAKELVNAYITDVLNSATGGESTFSGDTAMDIVTPHIDELVGIVESCLPEGTVVDHDALKEATLKALENALPAVVDALPDAGEAVNALSEQVPYLDTALKALNFIRNGGLRACALLLVLVFIVALCLFRIPGLRGLLCIGICGVIGALLCGGVYLVLTMPTLNAFLESSLGEYSVLVTQFAGDFAREYARCAVIYGVLGLALVLGTTVVRKLFYVIFSRR